MEKVSEDQNAKASAQLALTAEHMVILHAALTVALRDKQMPAVARVWLTGLLKSLGWGMVLKGICSERELETHYLQESLAFGHYYGPAKPPAQTTLVSGNGSKAQ